MQEVAIDRILADELERPQDLGTAVDDSTFFAAPGDQPLGFPLGMMYEKLNQPIPAELGFYDAYELWVVPHSVSIIRRRGWAEVMAVGIEVKYETAGKTCCVKAVLPSYKFVELGSLSMSVELGGNGEASPMRALDLAGLGDLPIQTVLGDLKIQTKVGAGLKFFFRATVATPNIQAVGEGSSRCEWRFDLDQEPLYGRDIQTWSVVVLPRRQRELTYSMRFYLNLRTFFFTTRRESDWISIPCKLVGARKS
jgi:hypothetical protein